MSGLSENYLEQYNILLYLQDSMSQLLILKDENPKVNIKKFFSDYFACVRDGNHTLFREYEFVSATGHNRASFVKTFWKCFRYIGRRGDLLSVIEYHSLLLLLCPDFPLDLVIKVARIVLLEDAIECQISFADFIYAFQVQFLYMEFVDRSHKLHESLLSGSTSGPPHLVVVPSDTDASPSRGVCSGGGGGDGAGSGGDLGARTSAREGLCTGPAFYRLVQAACERADFNYPPMSVIHGVCKALPTNFSIYCFLLALAKCDELTSTIGLLPSSEALIIADIDDDDEEIRLRMSLNKQNRGKRNKSASRVSRRSSTRPGTASSAQPGAPSTGPVIASSVAVPPVIGGGGGKVSGGGGARKRSSGSGRSVGGSRGNRVARGSTGGGRRGASSATTSAVDDDDEDDEDDGESSSEEEANEETDSNSSSGR